VIRKASRHRWCHTERLVTGAEVVVREIQGYGVAEVLIGYF
jgi:hypothetical protein